MNSTTLFYIILAIVIFDFIFERVSEYMNQTWRSKPVPNELEGIYDSEKYKKQQEYSRVNSRFSIISSSVSFVGIVLFLLFQGFGWLNTLLSGYIESELWLGLLFFGVLFLASDIISTPFNIYETFVIEERFGFNKTTPKTFIFDKLKGWLVAAVISVILYFAIYKLYVNTGEYFWLYTWGILAFFTLFMSMFYSNIIVPLFNKQTPLPEGELRTAIQDYSSTVGFKLNNIYQIDGSKRSTRANAYFTGFGPKKRIVLYDTLMKDLSTEEIVAVLAHEIGHNKKKHTVTALILSLAQMGVMLYILSLLIGNPELSAALGVNQPVFHISLIAFGLLYSPVSSVTGLFMNILSRKNEYQADNYAADTYNAQKLVSALKKLAGNNLSNLTPHPFYVFVNYSHPDLFNRVKNLLKK